MKKSPNLEITASLAFVFLVFIIDGIRLYFTEGLRRPLNGDYVWYTDDERIEWWHFEPLYSKE